MTSKHFMPHNLLEFHVSDFQNFPLVHTFPSLGDMWVFLKAYDYRNFHFIGDILKNLGDFIGIK